jgi:beta-1,4-mannosyltransferase
VALYKHADADPGDRISHGTMLKLVLQLCFAALPVVALYVAATKRPRRPFYRSVAILVLGDIGRSPRMMYHAESFAQHEFETFVVGYKGTINYLVYVRH